MNRRETKDLIRQLRATPSPPVPPGLERHLLDIGIRGGVVRRWGWAATAAAVAGVAAMLIVHAIRPARPTASSLPFATTMTSTTPTVLVSNSDRSKETRPCDIFPPLPRPF